MSKNTGGPAFPREDYQANGYYGGFEGLGQEGMSLRDYFAAKAMQGILSNQGMIDNVTESSVLWVAKESYLMADAMLKAREGS